LTYYVNQCNVCLRSFSRRAHLREHQKGHESAQNVEITTNTTTTTTITSTPNAVHNKTDFITLFDCEKCGNLFASESDLKKHSCESTGNAMTLKTKKNAKGNVKLAKKTNLATSCLTSGTSTVTTSSIGYTKTKTKPCSVNATLTTAVLGDSSDQMTPKDSSNSEFTFQFHDGLDDNIPTAHIEIITAPVDIGSSFPPIVTIDGIQYPTIPILTNSIDSDCEDNDNTNSKDEMSTKVLLTAIPSLK
jgi:hypothetical protein